MNITRRQGLKGLVAGATTVAMPAIVTGQEQEIVIGAPNSLTGGLGEVGSRGTWGMQIAVDQVEELGVRVRWLPSLTAQDRWHYEEGFVLQRRCVEAYLWNKKDGYKGHISVNADGFGGLALENVPAE